MTVRSNLHTRCTALVVGLAACLALAACGSSSSSGTNTPAAGSGSTTAASTTLHIAFGAADRGVVDEFHRAAASIGAEILHQPRVFPEYHPNYYGCFIRDLDGHNVEAVCHRAGE